MTPEILVIQIEEVVEEVKDLDHRAEELELDLAMILLMMNIPVVLDKTVVAAVAVDTTDQRIMSVVEQQLP